MDRIYIESIIQNILNKEFKTSEKRRINVYNDRIQFACPYCQDSSRNVRAKRGNIWWNKLMFVCFNCGKRTNFDRISKDFGQQLDPDKKLEIINHLNTTINHEDFDSDLEQAEFEKLIEMSDLEKIFNSGEFAITDFKPVQENGVVHNYLVSRGILPTHHKDIYQGKYWVNEEIYQYIIIFLNRRGNKVLGIQIRNLKEGRRRMFKIFNFESLYKMVNGVEEITDLDLNQLVIFNKLSYYFNILNVNFTQPITIFEGYLDSLFFPNSIGVVGVNTDMRVIENKNLNIRYLFDNDEAGFKKCDEKIKNGYPIFLWNKLFDDVVNRKKSEDPYKLMDRIKKVKDLNKLAELVENPYKSLNLESYFSKDIYDIKWIPSIKKVKKSNKRISTTS